MLKYISGALLLMLTILFFWYFFLKEEDYKISFSLKYDTENLYLAAREGNFENLKLQDNINEVPFKKLTQKYLTADGPVLLEWNFFDMGKRTSKAQVKLTHVEQPFFNRLKLIFYTPEFQKTVLEDLKTFKDHLEGQQQVFRINIEEMANTPQSYCACLALKAKVEDKALEMIRHIDILSDFVATYELETDGRPRVVINDYNRQSGKIRFDFCFPLKENQKIPDHPLIFTRRIASTPALKAIFNGNYMNSHHAWPFLVNYAESQGLETQYLPLEIYKSNPELGGNPLNWEAEIYMPIQK
ncbi:GyrI-like domain-containing protein [Salegentibacter sp. F14]